MRGGKASAWCRDSGVPAGEAAGVRSGEASVRSREPARGAATPLGAGRQSEQGDHHRKTRQALHCGNSTPIRAPPAGRETKMKIRPGGEWRVRQLSTFRAAGAYERLIIDAEGS